MPEKRLRPRLELVVFRLLIRVEILSAGCVCLETLPATPGTLKNGRSGLSHLPGLAIHQNHQQKSLSKTLVRDAILRSLQATELVCVTALLVHAVSEDAKHFYRSCGFL